MFPTLLIHFYRFYWYGRIPGYSAVTLQPARWAFLTFTSWYLRKTQGHKSGSTPVGWCLSSLFTCHIWLWQSAFFRDSNESEFIWKARRGTDGVTEPSPFVCQHTDRVRVCLSRNIFVFLQRIPIPMLGQKNQSSAHLRNIGEETHRLVPTGCIAN